MAPDNKQSEKLVRFKAEFICSVLQGKEYEKVLTILVPLLHRIERLEKDVDALKQKP